MPFLRPNHQKIAACDSIISMTINAIETREIPFCSPKISYYADNLFFELVDFFFKGGGGISNTFTIESFRTYSTIFWGILHQVSPIYFLCGYVENMDSEVTNTNYEPILMIGIENIQDSISHV